MFSRQELEQAITALETQRGQLGDAVVDVSVKALRQKMESLEAQPAVEQHEQVVVLVADLSDYTAMSEALDAEEVRDTLNALWERLDAVIESWDGQIDKHTGDGLIALFGLSMARPEDMRHAILAALDIQSEVEHFNAWEESAGRKQRPFKGDLRMRIGIDAGPTYFGEMGMGGEATAWGDTVTTATQLQQLAPVGGILVSYEVYSQVHALFDVKGVQLASPEDGKEHAIGYLILGDKPLALRNAVMTAAFQGSRLVGRQAELDLLQAALQATIDRSQAQTYVIFGETGIGKSRLLYEFEQLLKFSPAGVACFHGRASASGSIMPYGLLRDLFMGTFGIYPQSSPAVARRKLRNGINQLIPGRPLQAQELTEAIRHLLELENGADPAPDANLLDDQRQRMSHVRRIVRLFRTLAENTAVVLFLEDLHQADELSLDLIDNLMRECNDRSLLVLSSAQGSLFEQRPAWRSIGKNGGPLKARELAPLAPIDCRHLISQVLNNAVRLPLNLMDLVVSQTGGNPGAVQELMVNLLESGVVVREANQWRLREGLLPDDGESPLLTLLLRQRLEKLNLMERSILQMASVFGRSFRSSEVEQLAQAIYGSDSAKRVTSALISLERQGLVRLSSMPGYLPARSFAFTSERFRNVVYRSLSQEERRACHVYVVSTLIEGEPATVGGYAGVIADHFERAGERSQASHWYGRAGVYAQAMNAHETAIVAFRQALGLLAEKSEQAQRDRLAYSEALGNGLRLRARSGEAVAAFMAMLRSARIVEDFEAEARAHIGLFLTHHFQGNYADALDNGRLAEHIARTTGLVELLASALAAKAWAYVRLDEPDQALALAEESLAISASSGAVREIASCRAVLGDIYRVQQEYEEAARVTALARDAFRGLGDACWEGRMLGNLGHIAYARRDVVSAASFFQASLQTALEVGDIYGTLRCLRKLGSIAEDRGAYDEADSLNRQAYMVAERSNNANYCALVANDLGRLHLSQADTMFQTVSEVKKDEHMQQAKAWLERALQQARSADARVMIALIQSNIAQFLLEYRLPEEALVHAYDALYAARQSLTDGSGAVAQQAAGIAWRVLGQVANELPPQGLPIIVGDELYDAAACLEQSVQTFSAMGPSAEPSLARTLYTWALIEYYEGDRALGRDLWNRAKDIYARLGMKKEFAWLERSGIS